MAQTMPVESSWLKVATDAPAIGVDRANRAIMGAVIAQEGPFRETPPRGEFDEKSLKMIIKLMKAHPNGLKSRFGHPSLSDDAAGSAIGRWTEPRMDSVLVSRGGEKVELMAVRANLFLDASAGPVNPNGDLAEYLMTVAESDAGLISTSLVLQVEEEFRLRKDGTRETDEEGTPLPPLWRPIWLHASDITDEGAAVDQILSPRGGADLPDATVRLASQWLDRLFAGQSREVIEARCSAWLERYLTARFGQRFGQRPQNRGSLNANQVRQLELVKARLA